MKRIYLTPETEIVCPTLNFVIMQDPSAPDGIIDDDGTLANEENTFEDDIIQSKSISLWE